MPWEEHGRGFTLKDAKKGHGAAAITNSVSKSARKKLVKATDKVLVPIGVAAVGGVAANQLTESKAGKKAIKEITKSYPVPIIKSDDPEFNAEYANKVMQVISKLDDDELRIFTSMVVGDVLEGDIEKNQRTLQRHVNEVALKTIDDIKKSMKKVAISKGEVGSEEAAYMDSIYQLEEIIKAQNPYDYGYVWRESDFRRDPKTGQFQAKVKVNRDANTIPGKTAQSLGIPQPQKRLNPRVEAQYQQEYMQVAQFLNTIAQGTPNPGDMRASMLIENKTTGSRYRKDLNGKPSAGDWDPVAERVIGVEARPTGLTLGGAAFGLTNTLGTPMGSETVRTANRADANFAGFSQNWANANKETPNSNDRLYGRVQAGSQFLGQVAPYGSRTQIAARFGEFVGSRGPEAEAVFGPAIRRTAYRYRGTERKPDAELVNEYDRVVRGENRRGAALTPAETSKLRAAQNRALTRAREQKAMQINQGKTGAPQRITGTRVDPERVKNLQDVERERAFVPIEAVKLTPDETRAVRNQVLSQFMARRNEQQTPVPASLDAGRAAIENHLWDSERRPKKELYQLHLEAGNTPPSEGIILDAEGRIAHQAIGYGDDHYLPFNLKNLKALKGGEYIRTRSVGGPTSEDIYTGLMTGARRVEVVSRSGTFVVEFEDDFRGGRRHNDKARRMVRRYEQILDAVQSEQVDRMDVSPEIRSTFKEEIRDKYPGLKPAEQRRLLQERIDEFKSSPELTDEDEAAMERRIVRLTEGMPEAQAKKVRNDITNSWAREKEYKFRLNGIGYEAALKALEEQFPYYIKTYSRPVMDQPERVNTEQDRGYVAPGRNRPAAAAAGLYGPKHVYRPKGDKHPNRISAQDADYQSGRKPAATPQTAEAETKDAKTDKPGEKKETTAADKLREQLASNKARGEYGKVAARIGRQIRSYSNNWEREKAMAPWNILDKEDEELERYLSTTEGSRKFQALIDSMGNDLKGKGAVSERDLLDLRVAAGAVARKKADPSLLYSTGKPQIYEDEKAYQTGADKGVVNDEINTRGRGYSITTKKRVRDMVERELVYEIQRAREMKDLIPILKTVELSDAYEEMKRNGLRVDNPGVLSTIMDEEQLDRHVDNLQRMRALNLIREDKPKPEATEPPKLVQQAPQRKELTVGFNKNELEDVLDLFENAQIEAIRQSQGKLSRDFSESRDVIRGVLDQDVVTDDDIRALNDNPIFVENYERAKKMMERKNQ